MIELDFLELDEILGENRLDLFKKIGVQAKATDFAIMLGAYVPFKFRHGATASKLKLYSSWWTKTISKYSTVNFFDSHGEQSYKDVTTRVCGARPVIKNVSKLNLEERIYNTSTGTTCVDFGEYPQTIAREEIQCELARAYNNGTLEETGKTFTVDKSYYYNYDGKFQERKIKEYKYKGKKYVEICNIYLSPETVLSNGRNIHPDCSYWIQVEPITWIVDKKVIKQYQKMYYFVGYNLTIKKYMET